ncbi:DUF6660 family protein [Flavobacterium cellulosilyticum]|uniref:Uncharacterized protein n=1 Tax=Flavobacterium cellulosilyticum TaxID=2541731 RepID=A0A4R5C9K9_9FLAO|nr:hypothetical protein E0F76_12610 [Flavobacterium cellulosilyticum]
MNIISSLFSIYLIVLSCLPCADLEANSAVHSSLEKSLIADNHSHEKSSDTCSPFCICNCCGCQGYTYNIIYTHIFFSTKTLIDKKTPEYKSILTSNFYGSIWQPPQIA